MLKNVIRGSYNYMLILKKSIQNKNNKDNKLNFINTMFFYD